MDQKLRIEKCKNCGSEIVSQDGKVWVHGTISGGAIFQSMSSCKLAEPSPTIKFAVIINDNLEANLIEAFSPAEAIDKMMQHCIIHKIMVNKVIVYHLIEL